MRQRKLRESALPGGGWGQAAQLGSIWAAGSLLLCWQLAYKAWLLMPAVSCCCSCCISQSLALLHSRLTMPVMFASTISRMCVLMVAGSLDE